MRAAISFPFLALGPLILSMQSLFIISMIVKHGAAIFDSAGVDRTEVEDFYHRIGKHVPRSMLSEGAAELAE